MYEWWKKHKELLIECGFDKKLVIQSVKDIIKEDNLLFREKSKEFFKILKENNVPLIIMSSSLKGLIEEFIKQTKTYSNNIHVIANSFEFDGNGKAVAIKKIVHVLNKNETSIEGPPIYNKLLKRKNVLLLGDSLGDLGMIEGFDYDNLIKIGFLNKNVDENLERYTNEFDVVLTGDGDMDYVNGLLKRIL